MKSTRLTGFTLIDLLIAITIVAILAAIAYPSYQSQVRKSRRADGTSFLLEVAQLQERFYTENNRYATGTGEIYGDASTSKPSREGWYQLSVVATPGPCGAPAGGFCLQAIAQGVQTVDWDFVLSSTGAKRHREDGSATWQTGWGSEH